MHTISIFGSSGFIGTELIGQLAKKIIRFVFLQETKQKQII